MPLLRILLLLTLLPCLLVPGGLQLRLCLCQGALGLLSGQGHCRAAAAEPAPAPAESRCCQRRQDQGPTGDAPHLRPHSACGCMHFHTPDRPTPDVPGPDQALALPTPVAAARLLALPPPLPCRMLPATAARAPPPPGTFRNLPLLI